MHAAGSSPETWALRLGACSRWPSDLSVGRVNWLVLSRERETDLQTISWFPIRGTPGFIPTFPTEHQQAQAQVFLKSKVDSVARNSAACVQPQPFSREVLSGSKKKHLPRVANNRSAPDWFSLPKFEAFFSWVLKMGKKWTPVAMATDAPPCESVQVHAKNSSVPWLLLTPLQKFHFLWGLEEAP